MVRKKAPQQKTPEQLAQQKAFGERIRELREAKGWSQEHSADECGLDRSHMGEIERGEVDPQWTTIFRIIRGLGMKPGDMFDVLFEKPLAPPPAPTTVPAAVPQGG